MKKNKKMAIALLASVFLAGIGTSILQQKNSSQTSISTTKLGGDFELQGLDGPVKLSDYSDKVTLLFFGYTNCPDVCPIALASIARAIKKVNPEKLDELKVIFVSVDPKRDTVEHLNNYTQFFGKDFIGLTGTKQQIDKVVRQYGAVYRMVELENSAMGYGVDHSTRLYLIDRGGEIANYLYHDSTPDDIANKVNALL